MNTVEPLSHRKRVFVWTTILVAGTAWAFFFAYLGLKSASEGGRESACVGKLKQLARGMLLYAEDNNGCLPPADRWVDVLPVFDKYRRPEDMGCPSYPGFGYAMSARLSGALVDGIADPGKTPLVFDYDVAGFNASGDPNKLPNPPRHHRNAWIGDVPPYNNVGYADGSALRFW